ncbi:MAG: hypothetical protein O3C10_09095, partial [Chloroflexi bacterium]|nr:hypothetical protein [Chloroflexota bacterium]
MADGPSTSSGRDGVGAKPRETGPVRGGFAASFKRRGGPAGGAGPSLFWSDVTVLGRPRVLVLDAVADRSGWEAAACQRIAAGLVRRDIPVVGGAPVPVASPDDILAALRPAAGSTRYFSARGPMRRRLQPIAGT